MKTKDIYIGDELYHIAIYDYGHYINWRLYKLRKNKKWWQISNYEFLPYVKGTYDCPYIRNVDDLMRHIRHRIYDKHMEEKFYEEWENLS